MGFRAAEDLGRVMHTEEEAKTRWCPFVRYADIDEGVNREMDENNPECARCIASACMAWRLGIDSKGNYIYADDGTKKGFCGMAGRPE